MRVDAPFFLFRSLKGFNYRLWAVGSLLSNVGTWMQRTAQDWLVLTQVTHHDASAVGVVIALQFAPQLLLLPWTGIAADRLCRRKLLIATQATMGVLSLALGALTLAGALHLWHVYAFALLFGCASAFDAPVSQTFASELVGDTDLTNAVALDSASFNAARMIGPAVAGFVIASVGTGWAFLINGASFGAVLLSLSLLRVSELHTHVKVRNMKGGVLEGFRYVWGRPDLKGILLILFLTGTFGLNFPIIISMMAVGVFHTDARGFGFLSSWMAVGTVSGALFAASRAKARLESILIGACLFGMGCAVGGIAPSYWIFAGSLVVVGISVMTITNASNSLMQLSTEPALRGRVMALRLAVVLGGTPLIAPIVGWTANHAGPRWSLGLGALSGFAAVAVAAWTLTRWMGRSGLASWDADRM